MIPRTFWRYLVESCAIPANTRRSTNVVLMLAHRLRRWANIKTSLVERLVFAGIYMPPHISVSPEHKELHKDKLPIRAYTAWESFHVHARARRIPVIHHMTSRTMWPNVISMLGQRLWHRPSLCPLMGECGDLRGCWDRFIKPFGFYGVRRYGTLQIPSNWF